MPRTAHPENRSHEADLLAAAVRQRRCCLSIRSFSGANASCFSKCLYYILDRMTGEFLLAEPFVDAATGDTLWRFEVHRIEKGSPMT